MMRKLVWVFEARGVNIYKAKIEGCLLLTYLTKTHALPFQDTQLLPLRVRDSLLASVQSLRHEKIGTVEQAAIEATTLL
jgi:hypothetical protein